MDILLFRVYNLGIVPSVRSKADLEESTGAYKDMDEVMELQKDLDEFLKFIGYSMGMKDRFYEYLDEVDLDHLKTFCDSLSLEDKMKLIKG